MSVRGTTSQGLDGPGVLMVQLVEYDKPRAGEPFELYLRPCILMSRAYGVHDVDSASEDGGELGQYDLKAEDQYGDLIGTIQWKADDDEDKGRQLSPFSFAYPARVTDGAGDTYRGSDQNTLPPPESYLRPVFQPGPFSQWGTDERLAHLAWALPKVPVPPCEEADDDDEEEKPVTTGAAPAASPMASIAVGLGGGSTIGAVSKAVEEAQEMAAAAGDLEDAWPKPLLDQHYLVVAGTDERDQFELPHRADPRLVAPFRDGEVEFGEILCDVEEVEEEDNPDEDSEARPLSVNIGKEGEEEDEPAYTFDHKRRARLADLIVIGGNESLEWQPALLLTEGLSGRGFGMCVARPDETEVGSQGGGGSVAPREPSEDEVEWIMGYLSDEREGPLHVGHIDDKHSLGVDCDGRRINPMHISTKAYFYRNKREDGRLLFDEEDWEPGERHDFITEPKLRWDDPSQFWRWWDTTMVGAAPPPFKDPEPPPYIPPVDQPVEIPEEEDGPVTTGQSSVSL